MCQDELFKQHKALAIRVAGQLWKSYCRLTRKTFDWDDLSQQALLSLWEVCGRVDPDRTPDEQGSYIQIRVRGMLQDLLFPEMDYIANSITVPFEADGITETEIEMMTPTQERLFRDLENLRDEIFDAVYGMPIDCIIFCNLMLRGIKIDKAKTLVGWSNLEANRRLRQLQKRLKDFNNGRTTATVA